MEYLALQAVVLPEDLAAANLPADSAIIAISPQFFPLKRGGKGLQLSAALRQTLPLPPFAQGPESSEDPPFAGRFHHTVGYTVSQSLLNAP